MKHLLEADIPKIIRIGGRSVAPELEGKNLRVVSREIDKTRVEGQILGRSYGELEENLNTAGNNLKSLHQWRKGPSWPDIANYLRHKSPAIYKQLDPEDKEGWKVVGGHPIDIWLGKRPPQSPVGNSDDPRLQMAEEQALTQRAEQNINNLTRQERWALTNIWLADLRESQSNRLFESVREAEKLRRDIDGVHDDVNRRALIQADVVGITTTALARNNNLLSRLRPKVVICEEAAEVMEPHIMAALMPSVEHFIQIGDHRQLRPQINNHSLSMESKSGLNWQLDRSQFERRAVGEPGLGPFPVAQLDVQRRMRPEISRLIRGVYPNLQDHKCVGALPDVIGMRHNLFWLDHDHSEDAEDDGARVLSHSNEWEVEMAAALVRHLVRQGKYRSTDIALLTPYSGQLRKLRKALSRDFEISLSERDEEKLAAEGMLDEDDNEDNKTKGRKNPQNPQNPQKLLQKRSLIQTLRLATVDNFQGEEAKVIVVSLVRSNRAHKVGFLRTENRINVLLSRAQHGMYLIGNGETYLHVSMWGDVHGQLTYAGATGKSLPLCCPRHPGTEILCAEPEDFARRSPEGGCDLPCDRRLEPCGHRCQSKCHSEMMHEGFMCTRPCPRVRETCDHNCHRLCGEDCGSCLVKLDGVLLPCGHIQNQLSCYRTLDLPVIKCSERVQKTVPRCGHSIPIECHKDLNDDSFRCPTPCGQLLRCGHVCPGTCGSCRKQGQDGTVALEHAKCRKICDRPYGTCNHRCSKLCHDGQDCGNCQKRCEVSYELFSFISTTTPPFFFLSFLFYYGERSDIVLSSLQVQCPHSHCDSTCSQACTPCIEMCTWACDHQGACTMPCAAPCNRLPCDERCAKTLKCGHRCPSYCGETCPEPRFCHECGDRGDARVDMLELKTYAEIDVDESPVVVLSCGHFFTGETMDGVAGMAVVYTVDGMTGEYAGLQGLSALPRADAIPACPDCKRPIRQFATRRYNRVINRAVMDETTNRFIAKGRDDLEALERRLKGIEDTLDSTRPALTGTLRATSKQTQNRYIEAKVLNGDASTLRAAMDVAHQPSKKLLDAITVRARSAANPAGDPNASADLDLLAERTSRLSLTQNDPSGFDKRVTLGAWLVSIKVQEVVLRDRIGLMASRNYSLPLPPSPWGSSPQKHGTSFLESCEALIAQSREASLFRIMIAAILAFAKVSQ